DCRGADIGHFHSRGSNDAWHLVFGETGAAVFHYLDVSQGDLIDQPQFESDHAVRHELHEPVAFGDKRIISLAFRSNNPGQAALGEPVVEAVNLPPLREPIVQQTQKHIDRIEDDSSGSSRVGLGLDSSEHSTQVEFAGLDHLRPHLGIKKKRCLFSSLGRFHPKLAAFARMWREFSSKATKMPGSPNWRAPLTSVCRAKTVFPPPGPPRMREVRFRGRPPPVIASNPSM